MTNNTQDYDVITILYIIINVHSLMSLKPIGLILFLKQYSKINV